MKRKISWANEAFEELNSLHKWDAQDIAKYVIRELSLNPESGEVVGKELLLEGYNFYRIKVIRGHWVLYCIKDSEVLILGILQSSKDMSGSKNAADRVAHLQKEAKNEMDVLQKLISK